MTQAITARRDGDTFQARMFWWYASRLLVTDSPITRVGFESGPKSFDDIWIEYDPSRGPTDAFGRVLQREHLQCKWHGTPDSYGFAHLTDPEFINASTKSLLQRAHAAQQTFAPTGQGVRFKLVTNWRLAQTDPLRELINTRSGALRLERLYASKTDQSRMGEVRKAWREHLGIDGDALRVLAGTLGFGEDTRSLDDLRDQLNDRFQIVGLRPIPLNQSAFHYDNVVFEWMGQGRIEFDRDAFRAACKREDLLGTSRAPSPAFGIKSFEHPFDRLEDRCTEVLNLVPQFHERFLRDDADWANTLYPALQAFLTNAARQHDRLRLSLDSHTTLAFAAGSVLNIKSGRAVELEQRTFDRTVWAADDATFDPAWPEFICTVSELDADLLDLAVAIGLTHDLTKAVKSYVREAMPSVGRVMTCMPACGPGARAVTCGRHAFALAEQLCANVTHVRRSGAAVTTHLFIAGPNAFTFFAGQRQPAMGRVCLYEFDFEGSRDRSYQPSLTLPLPLS